MENIAHDKPVKASDTVYGGIWVGGFLPEFANDGLKYSEKDAHIKWTSGAGNEKEGKGISWWQVDFEGEANIDKVCIYFNGINDVFNDVPASLSFEVSNDEEKWTKVLERSTHVPIQGNAFDPEPFIYSINAVGRYLRIIFEDDGQGGGYITLQEVEVFGELKNRTGCRIDDFGLAIAGVPVMGRINSTKSIIYVTVPYNTDLKSLVASFTVSPGAVAKVGDVIQTSGKSENDFSGDVAYKVYSEAGNCRIYMVKADIAPKVAITRNERLDKWFTRDKIGAFQCWGMATGGKAPLMMGYKSLDEFEKAAEANGWSADNMIRPLLQAGVKYVIICTFHSCYMGYMKAWPTEVLGTICTKRDYYTEFINKANEAGLKVIIYITTTPHGYDWKGNPRQEDLEGSIWMEGRLRGEAAFAEHAFDVVDELIDLYGEKISGFWFDGAGDYWDTGSRERSLWWNKAGIFRHIHIRNPYYLVFINPGNENTPFDDYDIMYGEFLDTDIINQPIYDLPSNYKPERGLCKAHCVEVPIHLQDYFYWGDEKLNNSRNTPVDMVIKQMVATLGSKIRWNLNFVIATRIDGSPDTYSQTALKEIGEFIAWAGEAIYNTVPGDNENGFAGGFCNNGSYVVLTRNLNTKDDYIHVLTPPSGANYIEVKYKLFGIKEVIYLKTGEKALFEQIDEGIRIYGEDWDAYDTIYKVIIDNEL